MDLPRDGCVAFFDFVTSRHRLFIRRVVDRQPPPWTDDPVLARFRFTNVYRALDRGTRFLTCCILPQSSVRADLIWNVYRYRLFNSIETYQQMGGFIPAASWRADHATQVVDSMRRQNIPTFSPAYMHVGRKGISKAHDYLAAVARAAAGVASIEGSLVRQPTMKTAWEFLTFREIRENGLEHPHNQRFL